MANGVVKLAGDPPTPLRTIDNGDGTFSLATAPAGGTGGAAGKVAVTAKATTTGDTEIDAITAGADGTTNTSNRLAVADHLKIFNGTTWDRCRTAVSDAMAATGLLASGLMGWNGATWDRLKATGGVLQTLPQAGENHIGEVGGWGDIIVPTLAVSTSAYSSGHCVGGKLTLTNAVRVSGGTAIIQSVFLVDRANQKPALEILVFDSDPAGTFTDRAAFPTLALADSARAKRRISIATSDWVTVAGHAYADVTAISKVLKASGTRNLFAVMSTTSTPTFAATTDLILGFGILGN